MMRICLSSIRPGTRICAFRSTKRGATARVRSLGSSYRTRVVEVISPATAKRVGYAIFLRPEPTE